MDGTDQILPEEYLVAAVIMGLPDDVRKTCLRWSNKKLSSMEYLETKLTSGIAWNPIEINVVQDKSKKKARIDQREHRGRKIRSCDHCGKLR